MGRGRAPLAVYRLCPEPPHLKTLLAVLLAFAVAFGFYASFRHDKALTAARDQVHLAQGQTRIAVSAMEDAFVYAAGSEQRAAALEAKAAQRARQAAAPRAPLPQLPDTCAPALVALAHADTATAAALDAYESERQAAGELRAGLTEVTDAARPLAAATEALDAASTTLVKASRPSLLARLKPDIRFGGAVGVDPQEVARGDKVRIRKVIGLTFSWRLW